MEQRVVLVRDVGALVARPPAGARLQVDRVRGARQDLQPDPLGPPIRFAERNAVEYVPPSSSSDVPP